MSSRHWRPAFRYTVSSGLRLAVRIPVWLFAQEEGKVRHRDTHYFLWFVFFGVLSGLIYYVNHRGSFDSESTWLLVSGLLGLILGANGVGEGKFSRWYDLIVGIIFSVAGLIGIAAGFHLHLLSGVPAALSRVIGPTTFLGLSLAVLPSLVHAVLGLSSVNHAIRNK